MGNHAPPSRPGPPRILLTGAGGYLGSYLVAALRAAGAAVLTAGRRGCELPLDLADPAGLERAVERAAPDGVLNAGAVSSVRASAEDPERARAVNAAAPAALAKVVEGRILQVSSDLVFDGRQAPYPERARPSPLSVYGRTKAEGEAGVVAAGGLVVRVPLLFGASPDGRRGATDMVRRALEAGHPLHLFTDEYRTPLHAADAARCLVALLLSGERGIRHITGPDRVSRFELARRFCAVHGMSTPLLIPALRPDDGRPADVSLAGPVCGRPLEEALRDG